MNIIDSIEHWTKLLPNKKIMMFLNDKHDIVESFTYIQFKLLTDKLAKTLINKNITDKVLLVYPPGLDFMIAFIACIKAKIIPVPVYPPNPYTLKKDLLLFNNIVNESNITTVLTNSEYHWASTIASINFFKIKWPSLNWIITNKLQINNSVNTLPEINMDDIAFIQYTSGSCSSPKPIIIRHKNLADNINTIKIALKNDEHSVDVSWLPQYHDMGLIGSRLCCIANGGTGIYISPITFIMNPTYYIELCSKYKCTHIQGPNFMYKLIARKWIESKKYDDHTNSTLDLSSIYHIFNAAENISNDDYMFFYNTFKDYGLKKESLTTGYGLAESVVYVCDSGYNNSRGGNVLIIKKEEMESNGQIILSDTSTNSKTIVGCGWSPNKDNDIIIVKNSVIMEDLNIGEIYVHSKSIVDEYLTEKINDIYYLKTGDLGFIYNNELFFVGRCKDMIKINGKNYYPHDFEWVVEKNVLIKGGTTAVFEDDNKIILLTEPRNQSGTTDFYNKLAKQILTDIVEIFGFRINIYFLKSKSIIKTTSGKISRSKCKKKYKTMKCIATYIL